MKYYLQNGNKNIFGFPISAGQLEWLNFTRISSTSTLPPSTNSTSLCSPWLKTANTKLSYARRSLQLTILVKNSKNSYKKRPNLYFLYSQDSQFLNKKYNSISNKLLTNRFISSFTHTKKPIWRNKCTRLSRSISAPLRLRHGRCMKFILLTNIKAPRFSDFIGSTNWYIGGKKSIKKSWWFAIEWKQNELVGIEKCNTYRHQFSMHFRHENRLKMSFEYSIQVLFDSYILRFRFYYGLYLVTDEWLWLC